MSYFITAHRGNNKINMPIEEKHKYITDKLYVIDTDIAGLSLQLPETTPAYQVQYMSLSKPVYSNSIDSSGNSKSTESSVNGLNAVATNIRLFYRPSMLTIEQGTGAQQRIGDKVFLKNVQIMLNLTIDDEVFTRLAGNASEVSGTIVSPYPTGYVGTSTGGTITTNGDLTTELHLYRNNRMNTKQFFKFRVMIVRFDDLSDNEAKDEARLKLFIRDWFNTIYVPLAICPAGDSQYVDIPVVSNQATMLRESTQYTGSYRILYNEVIELNQNDWSKHIKINLEPRMNLTFKDSDNNPTTENFNNVFGFIIPPTYYKSDMDNVSYYELLRGYPVSVGLAEFTTNIKFTYYDI